MKNALDMSSCCSGVLLASLAGSIYAILLYLSVHSIHLIITRLTSDIAPVSLPVFVRGVTIVQPFAVLCNSLCQSVVVINGGAKPISI